MSIDVSVDAGIATLVLNRPDVLNALDLQAAVRLEDALAKAAGDAAVDGVVLTGAGRAFSAGGDLRWVTQHPDGTAAGFSELAAQVHRCIYLIRQLPKPVVAAVNGVAAGGGFSLALACDFRVLSETAVLRQAYTSAGLSIDAGGTHALPRLVGHARAMEIAAFDEPISADQALRWHLATRVVLAADVVAESAAVVREVAARSRESFAWSKRLLSNAFSSTLEAHLESERLGIVACADTPEAQARLAAFRRPAH